MVSEPLLCDKPDNHRRHCHQPVLCYLQSSCQRYSLTVAANPSLSEGFHLVTPTLRAPRHVIAV
jgi:hypothetical protein